MDEGSQSFRRIRVVPRPESSASTHRRMTPQSSSNNSSSVHLPRSSQLSTRGSQSGGSSLLQERLRERKVESARRDRRNSIDMNSLRDVQSSPIRPSSVRDERRPSSSGLGVSVKGMGVKQMEEQVSTLHKQNFDLKLEVHHRRERQAALEQQLEVAEKRILEQSELQEVNEQLVAELQKRDQAVEEAVSMICTLEDEIARLKQEREVVRNFDTNYEPDYLSNRDEPTSYHNEVSTRASIEKGVGRMPSFLSEHSEGTEALRSLYLPSHHSYSDATLSKLPEESDGMNSPRLSVLSESSFISVYGDKNLSLDGLDGDKTETIQERRHRKSSSVEKWIDERPASTTAAQPLPGNSPPRINKFLSINDILESPLQRMEKLQRTLEKHNASAISRQGSNSPKPQHPRDALHRVVTENPSRESQQHDPLPPTPDTISTSTLRHYQLSTDNLERQNALAGTFLESTTTFPRSKSNLSLRPRSAGETITSRREGHGWDTETQDDDAASLSSGGTASSYHLPHLNPTPGRKVPAPNLFDFTTSANEWGQDMMLNNPSKRYTSGPGPKYQTLRNRRASVHEPRSDDTVVPPFHETPKKQGPRRENTSNTVNTLASEASISPPDRHSSLSATTRLRKTNPISSVASSPTATATVANASPHSQSLIRSHSRDKKSNRNRLSMFGRTGDETEDRDEREMRERENDRQRATPPPIMKYRSQAQNTSARPSSASGYRAGSGNSRKGFGFDGAGDMPGVMSNDRSTRAVERKSIDVGAAEKVVEKVEDNTGADVAAVGGYKRWFGMGSLGKRR